MVQSSTKHKYLKYKMKYVLALKELTKLKGGMGEKTIDIMCICKEKSCKCINTMDLKSKICSRCGRRRDADSKECKFCNKLKNYIKPPQERDNVNDVRANEMLMNDIIMKQLLQNKQSLDLPSNNMENIPEQYDEDIFVGLPPLEEDIQRLPVNENFKDSIMDIIENETINYNDMNTTVNNTTDSEIMDKDIMKFLNT